MICLDRLAPYHFMIKYAIYPSHCPFCYVNILISGMKGVSIVDAVIILNINGEIFAFSAPTLTSDQKIQLESLAACAYEENDALYEMTPYEICEWFQNTVVAEMKIALQNVCITQELTIHE